MKLTMRELLLAWITVAVVLFVGTYIAARPELAKWSTRSHKIRSLAVDVKDAEDMLAREDEINSRFEELRDNVSPLPSGQDPATYLKRRLGELASKNHVRLTDRNAEDEEEHADLYTITIRCPWKSDTEGILRLLYDLQRDEVMFDIRQLVIKSDGKDTLSGTFVVNCIYTKKEGGN